jgi:hypothetical protein
MTDVIARLGDLLTTSEEIRALRERWEAPGVSHRDMIQAVESRALDEGYRPKSATAIAEDTARAVEQIARHLREASTWAATLRANLDELK